MHFKKERKCERLERFESCCVDAQSVTDTIASVAVPVYLIT